MRPKKKRLKYIIIISAFLGAVVLLLLFDSIVRETDPALYGRISDYTAYGLMGLLAVLAVLLIFTGRKAIGEEVEYKRDRLQRLSETPVESKRPERNFPALLKHIAEDLEKDGFMLPEGETPGMAVAYRMGKYLLIGGIVEYVFLYDASGYVLDDVKDAVMASARFIDHHIHAGLPHSVLICFFMDEAGEDLAAAVKQIYQPFDSAILTALYETLSGKVHTIHARHAPYGPFARTQRNMRKYIAGEGA
jgi:hypothetical protein